MFDERPTPGDPRWAEYAGPNVARYEFAAQYARGRRVLDAGAGVGQGSAILAAAGAQAITAVDLDAQAIGHARQRFAATGVEFLVDDCQQLARVSGRFDLVCSFENIEHLAEPERFFDAVSRVLQPDGVLLISTPDRAASPPPVGDRPRNPFHLREWFREEFRTLLAGRFAEVDLRAQVESTALVRRTEAAAALQRCLMYANPLAMFLWRKFSVETGGERSWKKLGALTTGSPGDYPIVPLELVEIYGRPRWHFAICRRPLQEGNR